MFENQQALYMIGHAVKFYIFIKHIHLSRTHINIDAYNISSKQADYSLRHSFIQPKPLIIIYIICALVSYEIYVYEFKSY